MNLKYKADSDPGHETKLQAVKFSNVAKGFTQVYKTWTPTWALLQVFWSFESQKNWITSFSRKPAFAEHLLMAAFSTIGKIIVTEEVKVKFLEAHFCCFLAGTRH